MSQEENKKLEMNKSPQSHENTDSKGKLVSWKWKREKKRLFKNAPNILFLEPVTKKLFHQSLT